MHRSRTWRYLPWMMVFLWVPSVSQVVAPAEIKDPELRSLQSEYMDELRALGVEISNISFEYPFYFCRKLDIDEQQQKNTDQRSIRFDQYHGKTVLAVTGNYYAAYNAQRMDKDQRARTTFLRVVQPMLNLAVPKFRDNENVQGYAFEVSHHILGQVMGVSVERPENLMVFLPQDVALKLVTGTDDTSRQAALLRGEIFLNAEPVTIWLEGDGPRLADATPPPDGPAENALPNQGGTGSGGHKTEVFPKRTRPVDDPRPQQPARDTSPAALASLQETNSQLLNTLVKELDPQVHFVSYTAPSFVAFRQGIYLELSFNTVVTEAGTNSRYKLAALAFDEHISHVIRPVLGYFKEDPKKSLDFDGIGFSTTIHAGGKNQPESSEAVEFFFPFSALRCYEKYDCTGQQLIDSGTVLINGERVGLDLQVAEGSAR